MDAYIGLIVMVGFNFAPRGWALCNGQLLSIAQNTALFSLLGTTYGGNGITTFGLPDLRGRVPVHPGQGPGLPNYDQGEIGGSESVTLLINEMPFHNHTAQTQVNASGGAATSVNPANNLPAVPARPEYGTSESNVAMAGNAATTTIGQTGGNQPHSNMQPYLGVNYIICLEGIYPARD